MKFDLACSHCVNEYEYCQCLAGLGQISAEEDPQNVSLALMFLTKLVLPVDANGLARVRARMSDSDFEVTLEWNATTRKTRHLAAVMVGWNHLEAQVNVIRSDQLRRAYEGPDDPVWWMALSKRAFLCRQAVYFEVLSRQRL